MASVFSASNFCPIIEPVKESLNGLRKALESIVNANANAVVVINPEHGDHSNAGDALTTLLKEKFLGLPNISAGILLKQNTNNTTEALACTKSIKLTSRFLFMLALPIPRVY
jgi:hypothetical protein